MEQGHLVQEPIAPSLVRALPTRDPHHRPSDSPTHLAVDAHAPALVDLVLILAGVALIHLWVVVAVMGVAIAVAGWRARGSAVARPP